MPRSLLAALLAGLLATSAPTREALAVTPADIDGTWTGSLTHDGDSTAVAFGFAPDTSGHVAIEYTLPALHFDRVPLGAPRFVSQGDSVRLGPFRFVYQRERGVLRGNMPAVFFPGLRRARDAAPRHRAPRARPSRCALERNPRWTFAGDSAMWAGPTYAGGRLYVGTLAGTVYALDAKSGAKLWEFRAGGALRSRPTCAKGDVFVAADDGVLYRLASATGKLVWQVKLLPQPVVRLPFSDPRSRYDRFGSDVTIAGTRPLSSGRTTAGSWRFRAPMDTCCGSSRPVRPCSPRPR